MAPIERKRFEIPGHPRTVGPDAVGRHTFGEPHCVVFVDGRFAPQLSDLGTLPQGVTVMNMAQALERAPQALETHLGRYAKGDADGFAALNTAFLSDGAYVHLARNTVLESPIHLMFLASGVQTSLHYVRNLIVAERGSHGVVVESWAGVADAQYMTNVLTEVVTDENAAVEHYKLQRESERAYHISGLQVHQSRDSRYTSHNIALGARLARNELNSILDAEGAECTFNGLYLLRGRQHVDNHTRIDHLKPHGTSREWYKGVLDDHSRGIFSGRIVVHPHARHTDARQGSHNLLLSENAEADGRPQLEIYADDVKCSHGATVGQLDEDALFYLRSRAIDLQMARSLLIHAFAGDVLERMRLDTVKTRTRDQIMERLLQGRSLGELAV